MAHSYSTRDCIYKKILDRRRHLTDALKGNSSVSQSALEFWNATLRVIYHEMKSVARQRKAGNPCRMFEFFAKTARRRGND